MINSGMQIAHQIDIDLRNEVNKPARVLNWDHTAYVVLPFIEYGSSMYKGSILNV